MTKTESSCSCGCTEAHVMARRSTADGIRVQLWSDGAVTCGINTYIAMAPRSAVMRAQAVKAAWIIADDICLYDHAELRKLVTVSRAAVSQPSLQARDYLRAVMAGVKFQAIKKGAVIRHALDCGCAQCAKRRAMIQKRPEAERVYIGTDLANGMTVYRRIR